MAEARYPRLSADGESLLACRRSVVRPALAELEHICPQPRPSPAGVRLHGRGHRSLSEPLYLCGDGDRFPPHPSLQRDAAYPTAQWTIQQLREAIPSDHEYRFLIHDRHATFSSELDAAVAALGLEVVKTPIRTPQANAFCERLIGTIRRECLDFMIPLNERHLRRIVREWVSHYNRGRPHSRLGPGIPDPRSAPPPRAHRHYFEEAERVVSTPVLGGLHHEYALERTAA